ncbi:MAG: efflux RND transporter periplasmic adaptor subunit [Phycisphaerales bacterium]|nr:MAG: efflux RND transporter periplasmic adaptor subunit [Phycisphaerales bacterium]
MSAVTGIGHATRGKLPIVAFFVIVAGALGAFALTRQTGLGVARGTEPTFRVRKGPLTISVVESGTIKSLEQVSLKSEVEGQSTLIYLVPEGTRVQKGDLLVELDASRLQDDLIQQQIAVDNAEAAFIRARENLAVARNQAVSNISKAELDLQFAQEDVTQYNEGLHPQEVKEAESKITLTREELERAAEKLRWSERLYEDKYISLTEVEADRLAHNRAQLNYELAVASLQLLEDYTSKRKLAELESNVDQAKMALERVKLQANADIVQAEADLKAKETELRQQRSKFQKIEGQVAKTKIFAPRDGLVVYATSVEGGGRHRSREPLQEGQAVRERQELIYLPSAESMMAEVQIHESSLEKVRIGLPALVTVDALPGQVFRGRVSKIAPLPDAQSAWLNPDLKVYPTQINLDTSNAELRTGMNCQAQIIVEEHPDVLYVPVQAVLRIGAEPTVFVRHGSGFEPQPVKIGLDNNSMVRVLTGIEPGQEVLLTPPLDAKAEVERPQVPASPVESADGIASADAPPEPPPGEPPTEARRIRRGEEHAGPASGDMTPEQREEARRRFQNMSPEEREAMIRQRMQNMSPEEREQFQRRRRERQSGDNGHRAGGRQ